MTKVVYNDCHGGAALSLVAMARMAQLGSDWAIKMLADTEDQFRSYGFSVIDIDRHDPILVQVVEELGREKANANMSKLKLYTLKGDRYRIEEYDGWEKVVEPDDIRWIVVK